MISLVISEILERLREERTVRVIPGPMISVNSLTSRAGAMYEKIRYIVDYKDEHTVRRSAILRMLKRKFSKEGRQNVGMSLLRELVIAKYLPNNQIPETVAVDIQNILDKYRLLFAKIENTESRPRKKKKAGLSKTENDILDLAASEIDQRLFPRQFDDALAESFYKTVKNTIQRPAQTSEEDFRAAMYIACRRSLFRDDAPTLLHILVEKYVPELSYADDIEEIKSLTPRFAKALLDARRQMNDPLVSNLTSVIRNRALGFSVVKEIIKKHGSDSEEVFWKPELLEMETKTILADIYLRQNHTLWVSGVHAAIYILLTKSIFAFSFEVPYEWYLYHSVNLFSLGVNIIFHPVLLLLMVYTIAPLDSKNMLRTLAEVRGIVYGEEDRIAHIRTVTHKPTMVVVLWVLYAVLFTATFGAIIRVLLWLHFSAVSIVLFLFFLALVSYFGLRIRHNARRWKVSLPNENTASLLWNFFTIPVIHAGRWLSQKFAAINVFVFVLDVIIETPFKIMLGTFDSFLSFLKEKEEDSTY